MLKRSWLRFGNGRMHCPRSLKSLAAKSLIARSAGSPTNVGEKLNLSMPLNFNLFTPSCASMRARVCSARHPSFHTGRRETGKE